MRALWLVQPLVCGPTYAAALDDRIESLQIGASVALWLVWGLVLGATFVPQVMTLTAVRIVIPAAVAALAWAAIAGHADALTFVGLVVTGLAAVAALLPTTGDVFTNGSSYGDERRMPLRPPGVLLLGPIELAWAVVVVGACAGPLLLLAHQWIVGGVATLIGVPLAVVATRALHGLARRWIVFVPAGMVLHDAMAVADPVLFARRSIGGLGPAPVDTDAHDLTLGALGLALEVRVDPAVPVTFGRLARGEGEAATLDAVLFTPSQPGELLREARRRRIRVG
jgi:hypothetical protein